MLMMLLCAVPSALIRYAFLQKPVSWWVATAISIPLLILLLAIFRPTAEQRRAHREGWVPVGWVSSISGGIALGMFLLTSGYSRKRKPEAERDKPSNKTTTESLPSSTRTPTRAQKKSDTPTTTMQDDEHIYEQVAAELKDGNRKEGLWLKAQTQTEGNADKTQALYVKWRVEQKLQAEENERQQEERNREEALRQRAKEQKQRTQQEEGNREEALRQKAKEQKQRTQQEEGNREEEELKEQLDKQNCLKPLVEAGYNYRAFDSEDDWEVYLDREFVAQVPKAKLAAFVRERLKHHK